MSEGFRTEELIFMTKKIGLNLAAQLELKLKSRNVTGVQVYFLVYILRHHPKGTYLTELCQEIGVSKATMSTLIKKMREKDYLYFHEDPDNVRKKKILPTAKLIAEGNEFLQKAAEMEEEICSALNQEEKIQMWNLERKLIGQLSVMEQNEKTDRRYIYREKSITTAGKV